MATLFFFLGSLLLIIFLAPLLAFIGAILWQLRHLVLAIPLLLIGLWWTTCWSMGATMDHMDRPTALTIGLVVISGSVLCLIRAFRNFSKIR